MKNPTRRNRYDHLVAGYQDVDRLERQGFQIFDIHEGGMGYVYSATDLRTGTKYAIKTPKLSFLSNPAEAVERFIYEAHLWIRIGKHPNIVQAKSVEIIDERPFLVLEYVEARHQASLRSYIGNLKFSLAVKLAYDICTALAFAYRTSSVLHLDLKPENILVGTDLTAKITDFGLSRQFSLWDSKDKRSEGFSLLYAAPESLEGKAVDPRTDIFSFGLLFYEMLTGILPYPFTFVDSEWNSWRKQLLDFYQSVEYASYGQPWTTSLTPWVELPEYLDTAAIKDILTPCLYYDRYYRWQDFYMLSEAFIEKFPDICIPTQPSEPEENLSELLNTARTLFRLGKISESLEYYNAVVQTLPKRIDLLVEVATVFTYCGMDFEAARWLRKAYDADPNLTVSDPYLISLIEDQK